MTLQHHRLLSLPSFSCFPLSVFCLLPSAFCLLLSVFCFLSSAFCLLLSAFCFLPSAFCFLPSAFCLLLLPLAPRKDLRIDALRIAKHYEANIAHILLSYPLNIRRCDCP